jgi:hypothetical protein
LPFVRKISAQLDGRDEWFLISSIVAFSGEDSEAKSKLKTAPEFLGADFVVAVLQNGSIVEKWPKRLRTLIQRASVSAALQTRLLLLKPKMFPDYWMWKLCSNWFKTLDIIKNATTLNDQAKFCAYMTSAETPPKGSELKEKDIALFCTRSKAHVAVGTQLNTAVVLEITDI